MKEPNKKIIELVKEASQHNEAQMKALSEFIRFAQENDIHRQEAIDILKDAGFPPSIARVVASRIKP